MGWFVERDILIGGGGRDILMGGGRDILMGGGRDILMGGGGVMCNR